MAQGWGSRRLWALVGLAVLVAYIAWIGAPYLRSVIVRDAAVTTWINVVAAPIDGFLDGKPLHVGDSVGKDGLIAAIDNPLADATPVVSAEADLDKARQQVRGLEELMRSLDADPAARARAALELADARVGVESAQKILASVKRAYEAVRRQPVKAPPDAYIWSLIASAGDFVRAGAPVASWVDCSIMLVDVPVSDVELALLRTDAPARIVIEGDRQVRDGKVYLTRGAAATSGADDLAALAKGRHAGTGQVLVEFKPSAADIWECPIGAAAYVDFPQIGILDMLRARLRL
jgi:multidrug resistance efflux pump